jgi:PAS domain S-box-containing protein
MQWFWAACAWFNVWARLSVCEADRIQLHKQIRDLEDTIAVMKRRLDELEQWHYVGTAAVNLEGVIIKAGERFSEMSGYPVAELVGMPVSDLIPARYQQDHRRAFAEVVSGRDLCTDPLLLEMRRKDGSELQVSISLSETMTNQGRAFKADMRRR